MALRTLVKFLPQLVTCAPDRDAGAEIGTAGLCYVGNGMRPDEGLRLGVACAGGEARGSWERRALTAKLNPPPPSRPAPKTHTYIHTQSLTSSLYRSMMVRSCLRTSCALRMLRAWMKFSKHQGLENLEAAQPCGGRGVRGGARLCAWPGGWWGLNGRDRKPRHKHVTSPPRPPFPKQTHFAPGTPPAV